MWSGACFLLLSMVAIGFADSESDELIAMVPVNDGSMEIYRYFVPGANIESDSASFEDDSRKRREVSSPVPPAENKEQSPPKKILFSDLIGKVEGSIVQSAVNIAHLLKVSKNSTAEPSSTTVSSTAEMPVPKMKRAADTVDQASSPKDKDTVVAYLSAKKTTIVGEQLPRVAVDHIAVSDAKEGLAPLLFSLDFFANQAPKLVVSTVTATSKDGVIHRSGSVAELEVITPKGETDSVTSADAISSSTTVSTNEKAGTANSSVKTSAATEVTSSSSSPSSPTTPSQLLTSTSTASPTKAPLNTAATTTTSTKTPIEKLKEVEDDLKEKVAEIEAEPIILSARV